MALRDLFISIAFDIEDKALRNLNDETDDYIDNIKRGDRAIEDMDDTMQDSGKSMTRELRGVGDTADRLSSDIDDIEDPEISGRQATGQLANVDSAADDASGGIRGIADPNISGRQPIGQLQNVEGAANGASNEVRNMPNPDIETKQSERKLDNLKEKASDLKGTLGGIAGALGGGAVASGIENLDSLAATLETRMGISEEKAENLRSQIVDIYSSGYGSNLGDVEQSVRLTRSVTGDSGSELERQSKDMLRIADAWGVGVEEVADAARANSQSMGVDFTESLNTIGTGMQSGLNMSGDYLETMQEFSPAFNRIGSDSGDMISILQSGMDAGIRDTDRMADSINEFGIRMQEVDNESLLKVAESLTDSDKEAQNLADTWQSDFAKGGEDAQRVTSDVVDGLLDMGGEVGYMETAVGLFGTMWEDTSGRVGEAIADSEGKTTDLKDATKELEDQYDTAGQEVRNFFRSANNLYDTLDQRTGGVLSNVAESFGQALPYLGAFALGKGGLEGVKNAAKGVGRAIKGTAKGVGRFVGMIGRGIGAVARFGWRITKLFTPLGWLTTLAIDVGDTIVRNWDTITDSAGEAETAIGGFFRGMWTGAKLYINKTVGRINWLIEAVNKIPLIDIPEIPKMNINSPSSSPSGRGAGIGSSNTNGISDTANSYTQIAPQLATGGLVTGPTQAVVGEGADEEAVLPLNKEVYKRMAEGIQAVGGNEQNDNRTFTNTDNSTITNLTENKTLENENDDSNPIIRKIVQGLNTKRENVTQADNTTITNNYEVVTPLNRKVNKRMVDGIEEAGGGTVGNSAPPVNLNVYNTFNGDTTPEKAEELGRAGARGAYREWKKFMDKFEREEMAREV